MTDTIEQEEAVEPLTRLGLTEYEARCFVALSGLGSGTAKEISEASDVPRTRVYDVARALEAKGLLEIQHTNPKRFYAVPVDHAVDLLRQECQSRVETMRKALTDSDED